MAPSDEADVMRDTMHFFSMISHSSRDGAESGGSPKGDRRVPDGRVALFADDLRSRLRCVCGHWEEDDFEKIVQRIARMKVRWSELDRAD